MPSSSISSNGLIHKMIKSRIRGTPPTTPKRNDNSNDYYNDDDDGSDFDGKHQSSSPSQAQSESQSSPTSVHELNRAIPTTPTRSSTSFPDSPNMKQDTTNKPFHPLLMTPTKSTETFITSNCSRTKFKFTGTSTSTSTSPVRQPHEHLNRQRQRSPPYSSQSQSSQSSSSSSPKWVSFDAWNHDDIDISSTSSSSLLESSSIPTLLSELSIGPSVSNYLSLVLPIHIMNMYQQPQSQFHSQFQSQLLLQPPPSKSFIQEQINLLSTSRQHYPSNSHLHSYPHSNSNSQYLEKDLQDYTKQKLWEEDDVTTSTYVGEESTWDGEGGGTGTGTGTTDSRTVDLNIHLKHMYSIADNYLKNGEFDHAMPILRTIAQDHMQYYGNNNDHPIVGIALYNIGVTYIWKGDYKRAKQYIIRALSHQRKLAVGQTEEGNDISMDVAKSLVELGITQCVLSDFTDSLVSLKECLEITSKVYGYHHVLTAKLLNCIGCVYFEQFQYNLAKEHFENALDIVRGRQQPDKAGTGTVIGTSGCHAVGNRLLDVATILGNIAMCLWKQKRWDDSISTLEEVLMVQESVLDESHALIHCTRSNLEMIGHLRKSLYPNDDGNIQKESQVQNFRNFI